MGEAGSQLLAHREWDQVEDTHPKVLSKSRLLGYYWICYFHSYATQWGWGHMATSCCRGSWEVLSFSETMCPGKSQLPWEKRKMTLERQQEICHIWELLGCRVITETKWDHAHRAPGTCLVWGRGLEMVDIITIALKGCTWSNSKALPEQWVSGHEISVWQKRSETYRGNFKIESLSCQNLGAGGREREGMF